MSKSVIDNLSSITGWSGSVAGVTFPAVNEIPEFVAGLNSSSLIISFASGSEDEYAQKTISFDVTNFNEITMHIWSLNKKNTGIDYQLSSDFNYSLDLGTGSVFFIPTFKKFHHFVIDVSGVTTLDKIKITALHDDADSLIVSYMVATKDEIPRDIFEGVKDQLDNDVNAFYSSITDGVVDKGILLGTFTGSAGDEKILFENKVNFMEKYSVILIDDGSNSETHQIGSTDGKDFKFNSMYDGATLLNDYAGASVYLTFPTAFGTSERPILLPGISIWMTTVEEIIRGNKEDTVRDTFKDDETVQSRITQMNSKFVVFMDCESRHNELLAYMSEIVRKFIARELVWINGKKIDIGPEGVTSFVDPIQGFGQIPKISYQIGIEVKEEIFNRETLVKTVTNNRTYTAELN